VDLAAEKHSLECLFYFNNIFYKWICEKGKGYGSYDYIQFWNIHSNYSIRFVCTSYMRMLKRHPFECLFLTWKPHMY